jgi:hypothetical protein
VELLLRILLKDENNGVTFSYFFFHIPGINAYGVKILTARTIFDMGLPFYPDICGVADINGTSCTQK